MAVSDKGILQGVVTQAEVLTAIAGELSDELGERPFATRGEHGSWLLDGRMAVEDAEHVLGADGMWKAEDHETVAGFAVSVLGHLPDDGETFAWRRWRFTVRGVDRRRIVRLEVAGIDSVGPSQTETADHLVRT